MISKIVFFNDFNIDVNMFRKLKYRPVEKPVESFYFEIILNMLTFRQFD